MRQPNRWSVEQLRNLRDLEAHFPDGKVVLFPIVKEWGQAIKWDARVYGHYAGVLPVSKESVMAIGASEAEADDMVVKADRALVALRGLYPALIPELERRLKELEAAAPAPAPALPEAVE
ncbi:hypothetical protein ES705_45158 [subsurface metagenome]